MVAIGKKVLGLFLLVCIAAWPMGCVTNNRAPDNQPTKEVIVDKQPTKEVIVEKAPPEKEHKTEVNVNN
jgi:hypothetical protein